MLHFFLGHSAKRHFKLYSDSITLVPLKLSYSRRASQQISTHVLRLLLEEVLGYEDMILVPDESGLSVKKAVQKLTGCSSHKYIFLHQICISEYWEKVFISYKAVTHPSTSLMIWYPFLSIESEETIIII